MLSKSKSFYPLGGGSEMLQPLVSSELQKMSLATAPTKTPVILSAQRKGREKKRGFGVVLPVPKSSNSKPTRSSSEKKAEPQWQCAQGCGACCKLDKGPAFPTPEEIFDDPSDVELYRSLIGPDGWCVHYDKSSRTCSIYQERPYFCRVEPEIFDALYGISKKKFNKEACRSCRDTIEVIYGSGSKEMVNFNQTIRKQSGTDSS